MVSRIAIIPARGGSKRIPKKNVIDFCGKPMIAWTIEAALNSGCFEHVLVSTDDEAIADISRAYGADVPFLRQTHNDDHSTVSEAVVEALRQYQQQLGKEFTQVVQLMANCPIRNARDICAAIEFFAKHDSDFQISCFEFGWMNPWWAVKLDDLGKPTPLFPEALKTRSQDLGKLFCPTGAIWMANGRALLQQKTFYGSDYRFCPLSWTSAVDIDEYADLEMAKIVKNMVSSESTDTH